MHRAPKPEAQLWGLVHGGLLDLLSPELRHRRQGQLARGEDTSKGPSAARGLFQLEGPGTALPSSDIVPEEQGAAPEPGASLALLAKCTERQRQASGSRR